MSDFGRFRCSRCLEHTFYLTITDSVYSENCNAQHVKDALWREKKKETENRNNAKLLHKRAFRMLTVLLERMSRYRVTQEDKLRIPPPGFDTKPHHQAVQFVVGASTHHKLNMCQKK